jgi:hypothetical protein
MDIIFEKPPDMNRLSQNLTLIKLVDKRYKMMMKLIIVPTQEEINEGYKIRYLFARKMIGGFG